MVPEMGSTCHMFSGRRTVYSHAQKLVSTPLRWLSGWCNIHTGPEVASGLKEQKGASNGQVNKLYASGWGLACVFTRCDTKMSYILSKLRTNYTLHIFTSFTAHRDLIRFSVFTTVCFNRWQKDRKKKDLCVNKSWIALTSSTIRS